MKNIKLISIPLLSVYLLLATGMAYAAGPAVTPIQNIQKTTLAGAQFTLHVPVDVSNVPPGWEMSVFCYLYGPENTTDGYANESRDLPLVNGSYSGTQIFKMNVDPQKGLPQNVTKYYCGIVERKSGGSGEVVRCDGSASVSFPRDNDAPCNGTHSANF